MRTFKHFLTEVRVSHHIIVKNDEKHPDSKVFVGDRKKDNEEEHALDHYQSMSKKHGNSKVSYEKYVIREKKGDISAWSRSKYYMQPDGTYVKGGDARSEGMTRKELEDCGKAHKIREESGSAALAGAPGNNTRSGPAMGDDRSVHMKKMRLWKKIHRRMRPMESAQADEIKKLNDAEKKNHAKRMGQLKKAKGCNEEMLDEVSNKTLSSYLDKAVADHQKRWNTPAKPENLNKRTHRLKPSYTASKEYKDANYKLQSRRYGIQKASAKLTGKYHYGEYDPVTKNLDERDPSKVTPKKPVREK